MTRGKNRHCTPKRDFLNYAVCPKKCLDVRIINLVKYLGNRKNAPSAFYAKPEKVSSPISVKPSFKFLHGREKKTVIQSQVCANSFVGLE
jgi:hypothetical protein